MYLRNKLKMIGPTNSRLNNNIINRRPQMHKEYMINNPNNNMNNMNNIIRNKNARISLQMNPNKNNNINNEINISNINNAKKIISINNNDNMNRNINANNIPTNDNMIIRALNIIRSEFRKKDEKIKELQSKVEELENKISLLTRNNVMNNNMNETNPILNNNYIRNPNNNVNDPTQKKFGKNFTFSEKYSDEINYNNNIREPNNNLNARNISKNLNYKMNNAPYLIKDSNSKELNYQINSDNQYEINLRNQNDYMLAQKNNNEVNNEGQRENSVKTWNSGNYHGWSKMDVKLYLKEVKSKLEPMAFKEFIHSIKLLTSTKGEGNIDKASIVERVRDLLGDRHDDLFNKFKAIIGYNE